MADIWNAEQYLRFSNERFRPALDLLSHVDIKTPHLIYDLGCGTGHITALIQERWPNATVIGVDNSEDMLAKARKVVPQVTLIKADLTTWQPEKPADLILSNATLQWLENHEQLFPRLLHMLAPRGLLAIQMPRNYQAPSHRSITDTIEAGPWRERLRALSRYNRDRSSSHSFPVAEPQFYYEILAPHVKQIDIWETEYLTVLEGENPVLEWMKGSGLRPFLTALNTNEEEAFIADYAKRLKIHYPKSPDGKTLFPFKRLFIIARTN